MDESKWSKDFFAEWKFGVPKSASAFAQFNIHES